MRRNERKRESIKEEQEEAVIMPGLNYEVWRDLDLIYRDYWLISPRQSCSLPTYERLQGRIGKNRLSYVRSIRATSSSFFYNDTKSVSLQNMNDFQGLTSIVISCRGQLHTTSLQPFIQLKKLCRFKLETTLLMVGDKDISYDHTHANLLAERGSTWDLPIFVGEIAGDEHNTHRTFDISITLLQRRIHPVYINWVGWSRVHTLSLIGCCIPVTHPTQAEYLKSLIAMRANIASGVDVGVAGTSNGNINVDSAAVVRDTMQTIGIPPVSLFKVACELPRESVSLYLNWPCLRSLRLDNDDASGNGSLSAYYINNVYARATNLEKMTHHIVTDEAHLNWTTNMVHATVTDVTIAKVPLGTDEIHNGLVSLNNLKRLKIRIRSAGLIFLLALFRRNQNTMTDIHVMYDRGDDDLKMIIWFIRQAFSTSETELPTKCLQRVTIEMRAETRPGLIVIFPSLSVWTRENLHKLDSIERKN